MSAPKSPLLPALLTSLLLAGCGSDSNAPVQGPDHPGPAAEAAGAPGRTSSGPRISFERVEHDFGPLDDLTTAHTEFRFTNTGNEALVIQGVKASCGCTTAELETTRFEPGAGDVLRVDWKPKGFGAQQQTVKVTSNDPDRGLVTLSVHAEVEPVFRLAPPRVTLGHVGMRETHSAEVRVTSRRKDTVLARATCLNPHVAISARPGSDAGDPSLHSVVDVELLPTAPKGRFFSTAKLEFEGPGLGDVGSHTMSLTISATVFETLRAEPDLFAVGFVPRGGRVERTVRLTHAEGQPFQVVFAEVQNCPIPLQVVSRPFKNGAEEGVELVLQGEVGDYVGSLGGLVSVTTDVLEEGPLTFLLMGRVGDPR